MAEKKQYVSNWNVAETPTRDYLVNAAINFLQNPSVRERQNDSKINFLKKKGLTDAEISEALEKVQYSSEQTLYSPVTPFNPFWSNLSRLSSSLIVFGVAIYGVHHLYKKFLKPWFLGEEAETESIHMKEVTKNLAMLTETVEKLHATVTKQSDDINRLLQIEGCGYAPSPLILEDVKREVSSLKSILISRHQFPAIPVAQTVKATIPSWQLPSLEDTRDPNENLEETDGHLSKII